MSKTLWHTIKLEVPKEMVNITKNDKVVVKKSLTKTNNISKANKEPSIKIIPGDTNKPKIISDGKEWNIEELKLKMKKAKDLGKKNEGKVYKKKNNIDEKFRKFKDENIAFTNGQAINPKEILFDKKKNFSEKLFMGTYPQYHFKDNLEIYKKYTHGDLSMKEVIDLFNIGYHHIRPYKNIKLYNKMIKDFIKHYDLKVKK
jgi:predicted DNA-binding protein YlxM (UPF0122 family)